MSWDKAGLKAEVDSYPDGTKVNWTELAKRYSITNRHGETAKNGGQIAQEFLIKEGINEHRFKRPGQDCQGPRVRRKKLRGIGGEISIPVPSSNQHLKDMIKVKIQKGEYTIGELVVPRKYEKLILDKNGNVVKTEFTVEGRKRPLNEIRKKMIDKHRVYMRQHPDTFYDDLSRLEVVEMLKKLGEFDDGESLASMRNKLKDIERTRHLLVWHDHSTVANHGHLVFMVSCVYDPALYFTPDEFQQKSGRKVDIQAEVERPEIYIVGRCRSTDVEQLAYCETRCECLQGLTANLELSNGITITDIMRFFKGDGPAVAFEAGQQKGGHYFCSSCGMHAIRSDEPDHFFRCKHLSMTDRQKLVLKGPQGRKGSLQKKPKPFENLKKEELKKELRERRLLYSENDLKPEYEKELTSELKGVQRVPALLFLNPTQKIDHLNLGSYEVLPCEPMHDISNHISNILEEIPSHLQKDQKKKFDEILELTLGDKEIKRATDYRAALVIFAKQLRGHIPCTIQCILDTLVEMQAILYSDDMKRCPRLVLRYHNCSFLHFVMCHNQFGSSPKALNSRKLYGKYLHNLVSHAPIQLRLISGMSCNAEDEERMFSTMKSITQTTSCNRPGHIIGNLLVRMQAEENMGNFDDFLSTSVQSDNVSKLSAALPTFSNTVIKENILQHPIYSKWYQAHLERISDFLLPGEGVWWKRDGESVEFFDSNTEPNAKDQGPVLHHFRSSNLKKEESYLSSCWEKCVEFLNESYKLPTHFLYLPNASGNVIRITHTSEDQNVVDSADENENESLEECMPYSEIIPENPQPSQAQQSGNNKDEDDEEEQVLDLQEVDDMDNCSELVASNNAQPTLHMQVHISQEHQSSSSIYSSSSPKAGKDTPTADKNPTQHFTIQTNNTLQTRLGKTVEILLGNTPEVWQFDSARSRLKFSPQSRDLISEYEERLAVIQTRVLAAKSTLKEQLKDWEINYYLNNDFKMVTLDEMKNDPVASVYVKKLKYADKLLKEWNISF